MDIEELRSVQTRERATDGLQDLRESFYEDVAAYLQSLREERDAAAAEVEDPFRSPTVNDLTDEIETAERVIEAIYERRIGKLVKQASLAAAGMPDDQQGLTTEEQDLYESLVDRIEENKSAVLGSLSGDRSTGSTQTETEPETTPESPNRGAGAAGTDQEPPSGRDQRSTEGPGTSPSTVGDADSRKNPDAGDATEGEDSEENPAANEDEEVSTIERTRVRVTEDIGEIFGVDERAYTLSADDVIDLPRENADPLVERGAAERLE